LIFKSGAQSQKKELALKWSERCLAEFCSQNQKEIELGLPLTPFMDGLDKPLARMLLQAGFVSEIVIPIWSALAVCFPQLAFTVTQLQKIKSYYNDEALKFSSESAVIAELSKKESEKILVSKKVSEKILL
jgi:hypothetical protein